MKAHVQTPMNGLLQLAYLVFNYRDIWGFSGGSVEKNPAANAEDVGINVGQKDPLEKENRNPFQYSCLGNPMDRGA